MNTRLDLQTTPRKSSFRIYLYIYVSSDETPNIPRAISVLVSFGKPCANFTQNLCATSSFSIDARLILDHISQPKSARGRTTDVYSFIVDIGFIPPECTPQLCKDKNVPRKECTTIAMSPGVSIHFVCIERKCLYCDTSFIMFSPYFHVRFSALLSFVPK